MFSNSNTYSFTEFYEGLQNIQTQDNYEYGRVAEFSKTSKLPKKITSVQSFSMSQSTKGPKKSSSTAAFHENDFEAGYYGKQVSNIVYHEESTKDSYSQFSSVTSMSSVGSMPTSNQTNGKIKPPGKKKPANEMDFRNKYKTEVCKYWAENGYCEFGDQCAFAHGDNEKRQRAFVASNYKTKKCAPYHETGYCVYGVRCQFLHCLRKDCFFNPKLVFKSYQDELENLEIWMTEAPECLCLRNKDRPRLPIFQKQLELE